MIDHSVIAWLRGSAATVAAVAECRGLSPDELWTRVRDAGDQTAFRVVVHRFGPRVYQICRAVLADRHLAEDAFQEVFVQLAQQRQSIRTFGQARAWVRTVAGRRAIDIGRSRRRKTGRDRRLVEVPVEPARLEPDEADRVTAALMDLPDRYRRPLELVYWDGLTHAEAAAELGWSTGKVNSYVKRGLEKLRAKLGVTAAVSLAATLSAPAPAVPAATFARLTGPLPAAAGWGLGKLAAVGVLVAGTGVAGVWSVPSARPPARTEVVAESEPELLQRRNERVFRADVAPQVKAALRPLILGDGFVELESVVGYDIRIRSVFVLHQRPVGVRPFDSGVSFDFDTATADVRPGFMWERRGSGNEIDAGRAIILSHQRWGLPEVSIRSEPIQAAVAAFRGFAVDPRTGTETEQRVRLMREAMTPYLGTWYEFGERTRPCRIAFDEPTLNYSIDISGRPRAWWYWTDLKVEKTRPVGNRIDGHDLTLSDDGQRLTLGQSGVWWGR